MALLNSDPQAVEAEVAALGGLDLMAIREKWRALFGNPAPLSLRHAFLVSACAYGLRTKASGSLSKATRRRLRQIAEATRLGKPTPAGPVRTRVGTRLIRAWGGKTHVVTTVAAGFEYEGKTYRSLSAIAKTVTGTNWNGKSFFGVKPSKGAADNKTTGRTSAVSAAQAATRARSGQGRHTAPGSGVARGSGADGEAVPDERGPLPEPDSQLEMFSHG